MEEEENTDHFHRHFEQTISDEVHTSISSKSVKYKTQIASWTAIKKFTLKLPDIHEERSTDVLQTCESAFDAKRFQISKELKNHILPCNLTHTGEDNLSTLQLELLSLMYEYRDLYFTQRTFSNGEQIRLTYCLHILNHILKTRSRIVNNNAKITSKFDIPDEFRDQGLVRPKVLILVPFKDSALRIIKILSSLLFTNDKGNVSNRKRFFDEFSGDGISLSQKKSRPEDYEQTFAGNTDDSFKIGVTVTKKSLKLYSDFYSSDIIVASPLGLRLVIGADGEADQDYDFLSSIEVLVMDQTEVFMMQNWDHLLHILDHMNLQPKKSHDTDFARIRTWALNGWSKYYRQTIVISSQPLIQISALVDKKCANYDGCVRTNSSVNVGSISQVIVTVPQVFYRLSGTSATSTADERFDFFVQKILPQYQDNQMKSILIYVPSYFDFIRLRNYFKSEAISFTQISEYTKDRKVAEARDVFFHNEVNYMLYSERFHFFMRRRIRGIRHLVFYQLPTFPHFYSEMCNFLQDAYQNMKAVDNLNTSVNAIYSRFDALQLAAVVNTERAARMLSTEKDVHMLMNDDT